LRRFLICSPIAMTTCPGWSVTGFKCAVIPSLLVACRFTTPCRFMHALS
jgi:hypothetical protein